MTLYILGVNTNDEYAPYLAKLTYNDTLESIDITEGVVLEGVVTYKNELYVYGYKQVGNTETSYLAKLINNTLVPVETVEGVELQGAVTYKNELYVYGSHNTQTLYLAKLINDTLVPVDTIEDVIFQTGIVVKDKPKSSIKLLLIIGVISTVALIIISCIFYTRNNNLLVLRQ